MRCLNLLLAFLLILSISHAQNPTSPALVVHLFRHGARVPLQTTYAQGWDTTSLGQLTPVGERQHYVLGRALAGQYPTLLGATYDTTKIYSRAATQQRIIDSLQSQLDGIYSNNPSGNITAISDQPNYPADRAVPPFESPDIAQIVLGLNNSEAIPGGYTPRASNLISNEGGISLLDPAQVCFNLVDNMIKNVLSDESVQLWKDMTPTVQILRAAGLNIRNPYDLGTFGDAMVCDYYANKTIPGNIDPESQVYKNVSFARNWYLVTALYGNIQQRQLLSVPLYNYIISYFDRKAAGTTDYQFIFLSAAETNVLDLLVTLNIVTADCLRDNYRAELAGQPRPYLNCNYTEFAAGVLLEFYEEPNGAQSVVFKYNNVVIPICGDQAQCPYDQFKALIRTSTNNQTPEDYQRDCLGRSLPGLESILQRAGAAVAAKADSGRDEFRDVVDAIKGGDGGTNNSEDTGSSGGGIISNAVDGAKQSIRNRFNNFLGRGNK